METIAKVRKYGNQVWAEKKIILPDSCNPYFDIYNLEIIEIEMHNIHCMCLFFQTKESPDIDVVSHTINHPEIHTNLCNGFKEAFELLDKHTKPEIDDTTIKEKIINANI
jgi:hypothetical protein